MVRVAYIEIINVMVATRMQNLTTTMKQLVVIDQQIGVLTISPGAVVHLEKKGTWTINKQIKVRRNGLISLHFKFCKVMGDYDWRRFG